MDAAFQNYVVLVEDKRVRKGRRGRTFKSVGDPEQTWKEDVGSTGRQEKERGKFLKFRLSLEIKKMIDL